MGMNNGYTISDDEKRDSFSMDVANGIGGDVVANGTAVEAEVKKFKWSKRRVIVISILVSAGLIQGSCFALMAPFYPGEALLKGNTATHVGIVFGVYPFVSFLISPLVGKLLATLITPKQALVFGVLLDGTCFTIMGLLKYIESGTNFFAASVTVRFIESIGFSSSLTCYYAIAGIEFAEKIEVFIPLIETIFGLGVMCGPTFGGVLYQFGGYSVPFYVYGGIAICIGLIALWIFPTSDKMPRGEKGLADLVDTKVVLDYIAVVACFVTVGFNDVTLALHLYQFNLQPAILGLCFIVSGGVYAFASLGWGAISKYFRDTRVLICIGGLVAMLGLVFIGPLPEIHIPTYLSVVLITQALFGIGFGAIYICSFMHTLLYAMHEKKFGDNISTHALVSGVFSSALSLGAFLGPVIGGYLYDVVGYRRSTSYILLVDACIIFCVFCAVVHDWRKSKKPKIQMELTMDKSKL